MIVVANRNLRMYRYYFVLLFAVIGFSCNRGDEQKSIEADQLKSEEANFILNKEELHLLVNGLLERDSVGAYLVVLQTSDGRNLKSYRITDTGDTIIDNSIPPPPGEFS